MDDMKQKKVAHIAYKLTHFMLTDITGGYRDVLQLIRVSWRTGVQKVW